jgi:glycosyltransferase involved in cell wall biosynthesis
LSAPPPPRVAIAIPAYNEADGIGEFLREIDDVLTPRTRELRLVVVDDRSTDDTVAVLERLRGELRAKLEVVASPRNRGHGPTLMEAYRKAVEGDPDYVLQVDGDGQFSAHDLRRVLVLLIDEARAVIGFRRYRQDLWFRMIMTRLVRRYLIVAFRCGYRDANCPLRGFDRDLLAEVLPELPPECTVPNLYLAVLTSRHDVPFLEVEVSHRVRRGDSPEGTTWQSGGWSPIPMRLVRFCAHALRESFDFRRALREVETHQKERRAAALRQADVR